MMNDDELLTRMRAALDEVHDAAPAGDGAGAVRLTTSSTARTSHRGWLAVAAVVLVAGLGVVLAQRGGKQSIGPVASDSEPASPTTVATTSAEWYVLDLEGFTAQPERYEDCCPPMPAPGPTTVMAWVDVNGIDHGVLALALTPVIATPPTGPTEPQPEWTWAMMPDDRANTLIGEAVPGSGLPWVLPSQSMRSAGLGLLGLGTARAQTWSSGTERVDISVGAYRGQFSVVGTNTWTATTVAGQPALRRGSGDGTITVVWLTPSSQWVTVAISPGLADREDAILGRVRVHEGEPTTDTTVASASTTTSSPDPNPAVQPDTMLIGAASVIDSGNGPMLANVLLASLPPQGGDVPLDGFDWSMIDDEQTLNGVTWTEGWHTFVGTWDGTTFHLVEPPGPFTPEKPPAPDYTLTPGCTEAALMPLLDALTALDSQSLHISTTAGIQTGGRCDADVTAWFDTAELRAALAPFGEKVHVTYLFRQVEA